MIAVYMDHILVTGKTQGEHDRNLEEVLSRLEKAGIRLELKKCSFAQPSVTYLRHKIDASGIQPTGDKIEAIKSAPPPTDITTLRSYLGLLNYYQGFPQARFGGGRLPPQNQLLPPKILLTLFLFTLSPLPLGYSPPKSFNSPPPKR